MNVLYKRVKGERHACKTYTQMSSVAPDWELVKSSLCLVKAIVAKMFIHIPSNVDKEVLYTAGLLGLINATQTFDARMNCPFKSYAAIRIKGAVLDELRRMDLLPRSCRMKAKEMSSRVQVLQNELKREASEDEICVHLNMSKKQYRLIRDLSKASMIPLSLCDDNDQPDVKHVLSDLGPKSSRDFAENEEIYQSLKRELIELPKLQQQLLALYYVHNVSLKQIAKALRLSSSRVHQLHMEAIGMLRKKMLIY